MRTLGSRRRPAPHGAPRLPATDGPVIPGKMAGSTERKAGRAQWGRQPGGPEPRSAVSTKGSFPSASHLRTQLLQRTHLPKTNGPPPTHRPFLPGHSPDHPLVHTPLHAPTLWPPSRQHPSCPHAGSTLFSVEPPELPVHSRPSAGASHSSPPAAGAGAVLAGGGQRACPFRDVQRRGWHSRGPSRWAVMETSWRHLGDELPG